MPSRTARVTLGLAMAACLFLAAPRAGLAQGTQIKPYMLIVFDTSGSMAWDTSDTETRGDGSMDNWGSRWCCPGIDTNGDAVADDSRIFMAKDAMRLMVASSGDITFGLMKFPQTFASGGGLTATYYYYNQTASGTDLLRYNGNGVCSSTTVGEFLVVAFNNETSNTGVYTWMNHHEYINPQGTVDTGEYELRAVGTTPLAWTIGRARNYFAGVAPFAGSGVIANDSSRDCRPYSAIILTDGEDMCSGAPATAVDALYDVVYGTTTYHVRSYVIGMAYGSTTLNQMADFGDDGLDNDSTTAYRADTREELSAILFSIIEDSVLVEECDGHDDDCDTLIDEGFTKYCNRQGRVTDRYGQPMDCGTTSSLICCHDPGETACNGQDDNCNGSIDEGLTNACGTCGTLTEVCNGVDDDCDTLIDEGGVCSCPSPQPETCNNVDDDCDTVIDDNLTRECGTDVGDCVAGDQTCAFGVWGTCVGEVPPATETCNNEDDDCNGVVDGFSEACEMSVGFGDTGACEYGVHICTTGSWTTCAGGVGVTTEVCNAIDDDCDTATDELPMPGIGVACGSDVGDCVAGVTACSGGLLTCPGEVGPAPETCNDEDDDCDGLADDGNPGGGAACGPVLLDGIGICEAGMMTCIAGIVGCVGDVWPATETCNGLDDDCGGDTDEPPMSGIGGPCGTDTGECVAGVATCTGGTTVCVGEVTPVAETCNGRDDDCDGTVDDGNPGGGATCGTDTGECVHGTYACTGGSLLCTGATTPVPESCNGLDDDCDGTADEGNPGSGAACGPVLLDGIGICEAGVNTCTAGAIVCTGAVWPAASETCNGIDDDCDGSADEGDPGGGGTCGTDVGDCIAGAVHCIGGVVSCTGEVGSAPELCDGHDNDCDGSTDEGNPGGGGLCGTDVGECARGTMTCSAGSLQCLGGVNAIPEICDTLDNDCDGAADEGNPGGGAACGPILLDGIGICEAGVETCTAGAVVCAGAVWPAASETCNGLDDDCDGSADEGDPGGGGTCGTDVGDCIAGAVHCTGGVVTCTGEVGSAPEICDGHDNDCDGTVDDGNPGGGGLCGTDVGECARGTMTCSAGSLRCLGGVVAIPELCDTLDNDCDGTADEGNPEGGAACGPVLLDGIGICEAGVETCTAGAVVCAGASWPAASETCNNLDDDCDGSADEGDPGGGGTCGTDAGECVAGEVHCVGGVITCVGEVGSGPEMCDGLDNDCDGTPDEGNPGGGGACGTDTGECETGLMTCTGGTLQCTGGVVSTPELCDGLDNDCDGGIDDGNPESGAACGPVLLDGIGICEAGVENCETLGPGSASIVCDGAVWPGTEACNNLDDDCDGVIDDGDPDGGGTCGTNEGECTAGFEHCSGGTVVCVGEVGPRAEICDGLDNDCDGATDEGNPGGGGVCGTDVGECTQGNVECTGGALDCTGNVDAIAELCNGRDDDCDGAIDEGNPEGGALCGPVVLDGIGICEAGVTTCVSTGPGTAALDCLGEVYPGTEACNDLDDDCNTIVDDGLPAGAECGVDEGECDAGALMCIAGAWVCVGETPPGVEICDGLDNDCDGASDEGNPEGGIPCGSDVGMCEPGITYCDTDLVPPTIVCLDEVGPVPEFCDGFDNDCNHLVDDGLPLGEQCEMAPGVGDTGACEYGNWVCVDGELMCAYGIGPSDEVCNGIDDDCDGLVDASATCPGESVCVEGYCAAPCDPLVEWPCPSGRICSEVEGYTGWYCIGDPCEGVTCEADERCFGGTCVGICEGVTCPPGTECQVVGGSPECVPIDCYAAGHECGTGERCHSGVCEPDPCYGVSCGEDQFCREGACFDGCGEGDACEDDQYCYDGACIDDLCHEVTCSGGWICDPDTGACVEDPCSGISCRDPLVCVGGICVDDPCGWITCPEGYECLDGTCYDETVIPDPEPDTSADEDSDGGTDLDTTPDRIAVTGTGGCVGCTLTGSGTTPGSILWVSLAFAIGAIVTLARRRRASVTILPAVLIASAWLAGCDTTPYCLANCDQPDADASDTGGDDAGGDTSGDADGPDAHEDATPDWTDVPEVCNPEAEERCNGVDDDCDDLIDEGFDLGTDLVNCGECGNHCDIPHAYAACVEGECVIDPERGCDVNYLDCVTDDPLDSETMGCETYCIQTRDDDSYCDHYDNDCDCVADEDVDLLTDVDNCGECGVRCRFPNAVPSCTSTTGLPSDAACGILECLPGYHDLDAGEPDGLENGCEYECTECEDAEGSCVPGRTCCTTTGGETCNGLDDECNGGIDDGIVSGVGDACEAAPGVWDTGECEVGALECTGGALACGGAVGPETDICNGLDDDCDGEVDDQSDPDGIVLPDEGRYCGESLGDCEMGIEYCVAGSLDCEGGIGPVAEACDGRDNDCNGLIDDGSIPGLGAPCGTDTGDCVAGHMTCVAGIPVCLGEVGPAAEICDNHDNDCNGSTDDGVPGAGVVCGTETGECVQGLMTCSMGVWTCLGEITPASERCNGLDDDCDGTADDGNPGGGASCGITTGECATGLMTCTGGMVTCVGQVGPAPEICDGKDNNCNGTTDEGSLPGVGIVCGDPTGECRTGLTICTGGSVICSGDVGPVAETCNALDDDCDGSADEGISGLGTACGIDTGECVAGTVQCVAGVISCQGSVGPSSEACDTLDNDCDGTADEGDPGGGATCGTGTGECVAGTMHCVAGSVICQGAVGPGSEACNGLDDDCDGAADEGTLPGTGGSCGTDVGECVAGILTCTGGSIVCTGSVGPTAETCNALDDDCDGSTDEGISGLGTPCGIDTGECTAGSIQCVGGSVVCQGAVGPSSEACDTLDNDCDGTADEGDPGGGATCGTGTGECVAGTMHCVAGSVICQGAVGPGSETCNGLDDDCDGAADEGTLPGTGGSCGTDTGVCVAGALTCTGGSIVCTGSVGPTVETCNTLDDDCDGPVDEGISGLGTSCGTDVGECVAGTVQCVAGAVVCQGTVGSSPEICDTRDNDCDGSTDEGDPGGGATCGTGTGECVAGTMHCVAGSVICQGAVGPGTEACNGLDDDCDGAADEGTLPGTGGSCGTDTGVCVAGTLTCTGGSIVCTGSVGPTVETCNTLDDDCDGPVDEGISGLGTSCGTDVGVCVAGTVQCVAGAVVCQGNVGPASEICDTLDNDCDGSSDEGDPGGGASCGTGTGECVAGTMHCVAGSVICQGAVGPGTEACNGLDDDCDGSTDEGTLPGTGGACGTDTGLCVAGVLTCSSGTIVCAGETGPAPETCNSLDDDCDGTPDDGNPGGGGACGTDTGACVAGTIQCSGGTIQCVGATNPSAEVCDNQDNDCDGSTDENDPGGGASCGESAGECEPGTVHCVAGSMVCQGGVGPSPEICDGKDNDCDTATDDGDPGGGGTCGTDTGLCVAGTQHCVSGGIVCQGSTGPVPEVCDTFDNDCDGTPDENWFFQYDPLNCGSCGHRCADEVAPHAIESCVTGTCLVVGCDPDWWPGPAQGCTSGATCCTYNCSYTGQEVCDGIDNDCDQLIDTADPSMVTVPNFCQTGGACAGSVPQCTTKCGTKGWYCNYGASVSLNADCVHIDPESGICDDIDNDCDGVADEQFPLKGTACSEGVGACRDDGVYACLAGGLDCDAVPGSGGAEACNGLDDNCDGSVDEFGATDYSVIGAVLANGIHVFQYEASKPNAASCSQGTATYGGGGVLQSKACSKTGVQPWTNVSWTEARQACQNLGAGWDLCTAAQWQGICATASAYSFPYGNTYQGTYCNGNEYDTNCPCGTGGGCTTTGDQDEIMNTGAMANCRSVWGGVSVYDMSGNVKEWTSTASGAYYQVRGGASNNLKDGLTCQFDFTMAPSYFTFFNIGFRCCHP